MRIDCQHANIYDAYIWHTGSIASNSIRTISTPNIHKKHCSYLAKVYFRKWSETILAICSTEFLRVCSEMGMIDEFLAGALLYPKCRILSMAHTCVCGFRIRRKTKVVSATNWYWRSREKSFAVTLRFASLRHPLHVSVNGFVHSKWQWIGTNSVKVIKYIYNIRRMGNSEGNFNVRQLIWPMNDRKVNFIATIFTDWQLKCDDF